MELLQHGLPSTFVHVHASMPIPEPAPAPAPPKPGDPQPAHAPISPTIEDPSRLPGEPAKPVPGQVPAVSSITADVMDVPSEVNEPVENQSDPADDTHSNDNRGGESDHGRSGGNGEDKQLENAPGAHLDDLVDGESEIPEPNEPG